MHRFIFVIVLSICSGIVVSQARANELGEDWHYEDVLKLIEQQKLQGTPIDSPLALLKALPSSLKRNFTLVYKSRNRFQDASGLFPRAIVYSKHLVYTFNGHPDQKGYNVIELMDFRPEARKIELREIHFAKTDRGVHVSHSESTPTKCLQCHGADPKPIWAMYSDWPGAYGSKDDILQDSVDGFEEKKSFYSFLKYVRANPDSRYAQLPLGENDPFPYREHSALGFQNRSNLVLTKILSRFNTQRLARIIEQSSWYPSYQWPLLAHSMINPRCDRSNPDVFEKHLDSIIEARNITYKEQLFRSPLRVFNKYMAASGIAISQYNMDLSAKDYLYEDGTGELTMYLQGQLALSMANQFPKLKAAIQFDTNRHELRYSYNPLYKYIDLLGPAIEHPNRDELCKVALERAELVLETGLEPPPLQVESGRSFEVTLAKAERMRVDSAIPVSCVYCHSASGGGPSISFDDEQRLRAELIENKGYLLSAIGERTMDSAPTHIQMPPSHSKFLSLSNEQRKALMAYVTQLARPSP